MSALGLADPVGAGPRFAPLDRADVTAPRDVEGLLAARAEGRVPLAGGTDLLIAGLHAGRLAAPAVWTGGVTELRAVELDGGTLRVGAASTLTDLLRSRHVRAAAPAVADGAAVVGSVQIRNAATIAGNLCNASPAADTVPGLAVHGAEVELASRDRGTRRVALLEFLRGPGLTALAADEVVTALRVRPLAEGEGSVYRRFTVRRSMDLAFVGVAVLLAVDPGTGAMVSATVALGAVGPTVLIAEEAGAALAGRALDEAVMLEAAEAAAEASRPITDVRSSADYRRHLVRSLVRDCLPEAHRRAMRQPA
jgi:carbon-monoxide dehydrogenase medium subunit